MRVHSLGPYRIDSHLATGGMAEVYVATRVGAYGFEKKVALKRMLPQFSKQTDLVEMFIDEARLAARLEHPNIVHVFDFGEIEHELFLAMELVDGTNVSQLLRAVAYHEESVPTDIALHIAQQTAYALAYAHGAQDDQGQVLGIVHRDVSPANILLTRTGHVKLSDFGIACIAGNDRRTEDGHVRGKLGYMSPEQVMGKELDGRSDVFTLATVLAEMILGQPLFGTGNDLDILLRIRDVKLDVLDKSPRPLPKPVEQLIRAGLTRDAKLRPTSAMFAKSLDEVIQQRSRGRNHERLARLLSQLDLVKGGAGDESAKEPGAKLTGLLDTTGLEDTDQLVGEIDVTSPHIYRVIGPDDQVIGPLSFPRLIQMITAGQINSRTRIAREAGEFDEASALPELTRFVTSPAFQWSAEELAQAAFTGRLTVAGILPAVHRIVAARETGVLHLVDGDRRKKIYFVEGRPEFVGSTDRSELLGEYLISNGLCLRMEVEMALALLPKFGGRLGDALVGLGVLRPVQLFRAISGQVRSRFLEAFRWTSGTWAFAPNVQSHEETFPLGQDVCEMLRDAVIGQAIEQLATALEAVKPKVLVRVDAPPLPLSAFRVPREWQRILDNVRGDFTFSRLVARESLAGGVGVENAHRAVHLGLCCQLLRAA